METTDTLDSFNKALDNLECVQIYDSSSGFVYVDDYDDGESHHSDEDEIAVDFTALENPVEILKYSITCDVAQYPESCPDPHGLLRTYRARLQSALDKATSNDMQKSAKELVMNAFTGIFYFVALLLGVLAIRKFWRLRRPASSVAKKNQKSTTAPPSSADQGPADTEPVTRQPSVATSVASSVASVVDEEDGASGAEELPYEPPKEDPPKEINDEVVSVQATTTTAATKPKQAQATATTAATKSKIGRFFTKKN